MATMIITGNLTKDAETKTSDTGKYVLLQVAENIAKRDEKGDIMKDENGHTIAAKTFFYSVFVNKKDVAFDAQNLKKGHAVKVFATPRIEVEKDANGYDRYILESLNAYGIDTDPFSKLKESDIMAHAPEVETA